MSEEPNRFYLVRMEPTFKIFLKPDHLTGTSDILEAKVFSQADMDDIKNSGMTHPGFLPVDAREYRTAIVCMLHKSRSEVRAAVAQLQAIDFASIPDADTEWD